MRLIDADLFMEKLLSMKRANKELPLLDDDPEVNNYDVGQEETFDLVISKLSESPTVDTRTPMDNIVEKLEYEKERHEEDREYWSEKYWKDCCIYNECDMSDKKCECFEEAINIVKQEINNGLE